jgi:anaerobic selenocysteine-containing dehydrogenase
MPFCQAESLSPFIEEATIVRMRVPPARRRFAIPAFDAASPSSGSPTHRPSMQAGLLGRELTASHWGAYEVVRERGRAVGLRANPDDPDPSPIGLAMWDAYRSPLRVGRPAIRKGWLDGRAGGGVGVGVSRDRGREPFVEVPWDEALDLVAGELRRGRQGVVKLSTGAWWDPTDPGEPGSLDRHGNPNALTRDVGASKLSQGCAAQTCLVQVERFAGEPPPVRVFELPPLSA